LTIGMLPTNPNRTDRTGRVYLFSIRKYSLVRFLIVNAKWTRTGSVLQMETTTHMRKALTMLSLALAMLVAQPAIAPALTIYKPSGHAAERASLHGTVAQVDQNRRSFILHWVPRSSGKGTHYFSYQQTFRVTDLTVTRMVLGQMSCLEPL
jgi:hypothetical protein